MANYVRISDEEMDSFMNALGFRELSREARGRTVKEKVFERPFHEGRIRVYSSVEDRPGRLAAGRKMGRDAIRVQYWVDDTKVFGAKRVHRVVNWRRNMLNRVYEIEDMFGHRPVPRDSSGEPMVIRTSKEGKKFWGSRNFPRNKDTRRFNAQGATQPPVNWRIRKQSCCCGATIDNPCECMYKGVMTCRADEPKCPCYAAKTEVKEAVVIAPRKPIGIVDKVMMNHAMMEEARLQEMINYLENMVQLGVLSEEEVMRELYKTFGSEYYFDDSVEDIVMDEYLEDEDYEDAEIYARNAMKKLNADDWAKTGDKCYLCRHKVITNAMGRVLILNECLNCGRYGHEGCGHPTSTGYYCARCYDSGHSAAETFHPRQKGTCVACGGKFSWNEERCLDCGSGANLWSFDSETFGVDAEDEEVTRYGETQEEFFKRIVASSEELAEQAAEWPLDYLGWWFDMANESYGGSPQDMLEKPWNWKQEMARYLVEGGYDASAYDEEDVLALKDLGFDYTYPPYLTMDELRQLYSWLPDYQDYKDYVHNYYRAEYEQVTNSPLGIIVKDADGKTYVLVPEDLAQIIFEQTKYVLDAEWREDELLYPDELNLGMIPVGGTHDEKLYVATRNEGEEIITYVVKEETIDNEKLYRILVVIEMDGHETMMIVANSLNAGVPYEM